MGWSIQWLGIWFGGGSALNIAVFYIPFFVGVPQLVFVMLVSCFLVLGVSWRVGRRLRLQGRLFPSCQPARTLEVLAILAAFTSYAWVHFTVFMGLFGPSHT